MSSELVQNGFFEAASTSGNGDEIIISADWMALSDDDFEQEAIEHHKDLNQQEAVIDAFKNLIIKQKGELYITAKAKLKHGRWLNLLKKIDVSPDMAEDYIRLAKEHGQELSNSGRVRNLSFRQWRRISYSPESHQIIAKIESGDIEISPSAIKAELVAAKQRANEAETKNKQLQSQFDFFKQDAEHKEEVLKRKIEQAKVEQEKRDKEEINQLRQKIEDLEKEPVSPAIRAHIEELETELKERTRQRDNLAKLREQLSNELDEQRDANKARHEQEMYEHRINDRVKKITEEWGKCSVSLLGQLPSPIESQVVNDGNWALIDHVADMAQRIIDSISQLKTSKTSLFLESEMSNAD